MAEHDDNVISINTSRLVERTIAPLGGCVIGSLTAQHEFRLWEMMENPMRAPYRAYANELISCCLREPRLSGRDIDCLPERARAALRTAVAEACRISGDVRRLRART